MSVMMKRQLDPQEKTRILEVYGRKCFATGHEIPEGEPIWFDHIRPFSQGGPSELDNIAPMCAKHNREKSTLSLFDFRTKLRLQNFFDTGDRLTLKHLLGFLHKINEISEFGQPVSIKHTSSDVMVESASNSESYRLYKCPATGWEYFYATLPVTLIDSDDDEDQSIGLQPRYLILDKVFELFRHFQQHPVLQPSVGRIVNNHIRIFDGQHKLAALLWNGRREFECKVYLNPEIRLLNQTNIAAHDKYAQTRFFSSIMVLKLGSQFGADFEAYKTLEDDKPKSESAFLEFLRSKDGGTLTTAQLNDRFRSFLYNAVLQHEENRLSKFVSDGNRSTDEKPLTIDMLSKSLFSDFLLREATDDNMTTTAYLRDNELLNMVALMNVFHDLGMHSWNPNAPSSDDNQRRLKRMFRSKPMMAWSEILKDAVCAKLELHDSDEKTRPFYRVLNPDAQNRIKDIVLRLFAWTRWVAPANDEFDRISSDNKNAVKDWLRKKGLTTGYLMGAPE
jgi:hypothetical protein